MASDPRDTTSISHDLSGTGQWLLTTEFKRPLSAFRRQVSRAQGAEFPPEFSRYHLYVTYASPWAHRVMILRHLKGLQPVISVTAMHWHEDEKGVRFATEAEQKPRINMVPDPHHKDCEYLRDVYFKSDPRYQGHITTPVLYDIKSGRIVSNESADILKMMDSEFDDLLPEDRRMLSLVTLVPHTLVFDILTANAWIYTDLNNAVYRAGYAKTQEAYEEAAITVFRALDRVEGQLHRVSADGPYFFGCRMTETDIRLFTTIIRFDAIYVQHFKLNMQSIRSGYPAIHDWLRRLYWNVPAFRETTNFEHIKLSYTRSQIHTNPSGITPLGPEPNILPLDEGNANVQMGPNNAIGEFVGYRDWIT